jgi:hypothetical protein
MEKHKAKHKAMTKGTERLIGYYPLNAQSFFFPNRVSRLAKDISIVCLVFWLWASLVAQRNWLAGLVRLGKSTTVIFGLLCWACIVFFFLVFYCL